ANPEVLPGFEHTKQFYLYISWCISNFIQKDSPIMSLLKISFSRFMRTGKGSFFMAKKLTLNDPFWNSSTIYNDHILMLAITYLVNCFGCNILTNAALTLLQYSNISACYLYYFVDNLL